MNSKQSLILLATIGLQSQAPMDACTGIKAVMAQSLRHVLLNGQKVL